MKRGARLDLSVLVELLPDIFLQPVDSSFIGRPIFAQRGDLLMDRYDLLPHVMERLPGATDSESEEDVRGQHGNGKQRQRCKDTGHG